VFLNGVFALCDMSFLKTLTALLEHK